MPLRAPRSTSSRLAASGHFLIPVGLTALIRLSVLGRPPFTDDGWYAAAAWFSHQGVDPIAHSPISAYARSLAWVFNLTWNPFLSLRLCDGLAACLAALGVFSLLRCFIRPFPACIAASLWALAANHPRFIDAGFKNPIIAATGLLAFAITCILCRAARRHTTHALLAGVLAALACLTREALAPFALALFITCWLRLGPRRAILFSVSGILTTLLALALIAGGPLRIPALIHHWLLNAAALANLETVVKSRWSVIWLDSAQQAMHAGLWPFCLSAIVGGMCLVRGRALPPRLRHVRVLGWLLLLAPLPEMLSKLAFPYHFSQFYLGLFLLVALADRRLRRSRLRAATWTAAALAAAWPFVRSVDYARYSWNESRRWWPCMVEGHADSALIKDAFYLRLSDAVKSRLRPGDQLLTSGFYFGIFASARAMPLSGDAADATFLTCMNAGVPPTTALAFHPPRIVIESHRIPTDISTFIPGFPRGYTLAESLEPGAYASYFAFDARIWIRNDDAPAKSP